MPNDTDPIVLENRHTGERLALRRVRRSGEVWLELKGSLPPHSEGPPLHVHFVENEEGRVVAGTLSAVVDGETCHVEAGGEARFPPGSLHRWWNEGDQTLVFEGYSGPLVDLDRYLQAIFDVLNAGRPDRPSLFYMAHVARRHRRTQAVLVGPRAVQTILFPLVVALGSLLGKYRGADWPGSPARVRETPLVDSPDA